MHRLKWTVVNETLKVCTVKDSKNVIVKYLIGFTNAYLNRPISCPLHGVYNWTRNRNDNAGFNNTLTFMKNLKGSSIVELNAVFTGKPEGEERTTLATILYFLRVK